MRGLNLSVTAAVATLAAAATSGAEAGAGSSAPDAGCPRPAPAMAYVPPGEVLLGEDGDANPGRRVAVEGFWIDRHEVTNRQFAAFVDATGHRTRAEAEGGSAVFARPDLARLASHGEADLEWWRFVPSASWRHPNGPGSSLDGRRMDEPVVHVTYDDALAYARWTGRDLPDEAQWERAARGGQDGPKVSSEWAYSPEGQPIANSWQGIFPVVNTGEDGFEGPAPAGCFPPNAYGLHDMIGNVWEWTSSPGRRDGQDLVRLVKGGSYLCSLDYCANFRPAARQAQERDLGTSHVGFRTISPRPPSPPQG